VDRNQGRSSVKTKEPERILLVKLSAIGDVVHTLPFLEALQSRFPNARIDWLVEEESRGIVADHPGLSRLIVSRRKSWYKRLGRGREMVCVLREVAGFIKALRSVDYDLVIDLQGLFKSGILTALVKGARKIGPSGGREGSRLALTERPVPVDYGKHAVDRYLQVARALGCVERRFSGVVPLNGEDEIAADTLMEELGLTGRKIVAINPMARWRTKLWDPARFVALIDRMAEELDTAVILTGGPADRFALEALRRASSTRPPNLAGRTTLKEAAALYTRCDALVTTDTGPMHLASAVGCPVVALFGPTAPWRTGPYGPDQKVVRAELDCIPCFRKRCRTMYCMKAITIDMVMDELKAVLSMRTSPPSQCSSDGKQA
jgi:heptosyltransferase I